jgi:hypothetical protein
MSLMHGANMKIKTVTSRLYVPARYKILIQFTELVTKLVNFMVQKDSLTYSQNLTTGLYSTMTPHSTLALSTPFKSFDSAISSTYIQESSSETKMYLTLPYIYYTHCPSNRLFKHLTNTSSALKDPKLDITSFSLSYCSLLQSPSSNL